MKNLSRIQQVSSPAIKKAHDPLADRFVDSLLLVIGPDMPPESDWVRESAKYNAREKFTSDELATAIRLVHQYRDIMLRLVDSARDLAFSIEMDRADDPDLIR